MATLKLNISEKELKEHYKSFLVESVELISRGNIVKDDKFVDYLVKATTKIDRKDTPVVLEITD